MRVLFLGEADVARLLRVDALVDAVADGFRQLSSGSVSMPPRTAARSADGLVGSMSAFVPEPSGALAVKLVSVFARNHERGLPSHQALIALFDHSTGAALAVMDGTRITAIRTAAASAVSVKLLARADARVLAVIGAGVQGHAHLEAVPMVREFREIRVASRTVESAEAAAELHPSARAVGSYEEAVRGADVVCACTDSSEPVVRLAWLKAGAHVTSVGSAFDGAELDPDLIRGARLFVESRIAFQPAPAGANELQGLNADDATEIGEVLLGKRPGRSNDEQLTVYKSMGVALEDAVAAKLVYEAAKSTGAGAEVEL